MAIYSDDVLNIISNILPKKTFEIISIEEANNRICIEDIKATSNLPKFNNSTMDGYALINLKKDDILNVEDIIFAGDNNKNLIKNNSCIKIMTGARVPLNALAVVPKENVELLENNKIKLINDIKKNHFIRFIGEDIKIDDLLISKNTKLNFSHITLLAAQGNTHIKVYKKTSLVIFGSGEELKLHYEQIQAHQIYNSNTLSLISRCKELDCNPTFIGQAQDTKESIKELILNSLDHDLIITTGGVSVGDADFTREAFLELNMEILFDGIIIKPGKPTIFGKIGNTYILNLPGNPLASALVFEVFGKVLLNVLSGKKDIYLNYINSFLEEDLINKKGADTIIPGFFNGESFKAEEKRAPGMVSTLSKCNAMIILDKNVHKLEKNKKVKVLPIAWDFYSKNKKDYLTYE